LLRPVNSAIADDNSRDSAADIGDVKLTADWLSCLKHSKRRSMIWHWVFDNDISHTQLRALRQHQHSLRGIGF